MFAHSLSRFICPMNGDVSKHCGTIRLRQQRLEKVEVGTFGTWDIGDKVSADVDGTFGV